MDNTWLVANRNKLIAWQNEHYARPKTDEIRLHLGSGHLHWPGYVNLDKYTQEADIKADAVVVSSSWHRHYTAERLQFKLDAKKVKIIPLGIDKSKFLNVVNRDYSKVIYSSNPDRGLYVLKNMWAEISDKVPGIHLAITYGWEGLKTWGNSKEWIEKTEADKKIVEDWANDAKNVKITGRLTKQALYNEMQTSALCLYPNTFYETMCLTALETQAAGTPMITTDLGALSTTLGAGNVLISGDPWNLSYQAQFIATAIDLLLDSSRLAAYAKLCKDHISSTKCDWRDTADQWEQLLFEVC